MPAPQFALSGKISEAKKILKDNKSRGSSEDLKPEKRAMLEAKLAGLLEQQEEERQHRQAAKINTHTTSVVDAAATRVIDTLMEAIPGSKRRRTSAGSATPIAPGTPQSEDEVPPQPAATAPVKEESSSESEDDAATPAEVVEEDESSSVSESGDEAAKPAAEPAAEPAKVPEVVTDKETAAAFTPGARKDATIARLTLEADLLRQDLALAEKNATIAKLQAECDRLTIARLTAKCAKEECDRA